MSNSSSASSTSLFTRGESAKLRGDGPLEYGESDLALALLFELSGCEVTEPK